MGKFGRARGLNFYEMQRQKAEKFKQQAQQELKDTPSQDTEAIADSFTPIQLPTEQLQEMTPQTAPISEDSEQSTEQLPDIANLRGREEIVGKVGEDQEVGATPEKVTESIAGTAIPSLSTEMYGGVAGNIPGKDKVELYKEQLKDESVMRMNLDDQGAQAFGEAVDLVAAQDFSKRKRNDEDEETTTTMTNLLNVGAKSFQTKNQEFNLFGKKIDVTSAGNELTTDPHGFLKRNSDEINYAIKGTDKLNMLEDPADLTSDIRPEVGRAAMIATILELTDRLSKQADEVDKEVNRRQFDNALDRSDIGKAVGSRLERLLYPSADADPNRPYTGESEGFGFKYRTTERERSLLGQAVVQGFADAPFLDFMESFDVKTPGEKKSKISFRLTRQGNQEIHKIRRALKRVLGVEGYDRPVSLVPPTSEGRLIGEGAQTQKQITSQLKKNELPPKVLQAIDKLRRVPHAVSLHKILLMQGVMSAGKDNLVPFFSKVTKQDSAYLEKKKNEFLNEYLARAERDPDFKPQELGQFDTFEQAAIYNATQVADRHREMREDVISDAINRMDRSFFYGYTAINNSSRLMISNTELNYQADKVARFLVDGANPSTFKKNSNDEIENGFFSVLARSILPNADKMTPEGQVAELKKKETLEYYTDLGKQLLAFTEANKQVIGNLRTVKADPSTIDAALQSDVPLSAPALEISEELEKYLNEMGKDNFYFAMDALHELARWDATQPGNDFVTRVKAEADGNANGATIQAFQMGEKNILEKGGVLYSKERLSLLNQGLSQEEASLIEDDIRDDVFRVLQSNEKLVKEQRNWANIFNDIKAQNKVKELMKQPIMTSIYGKDAKYHGDTAKKFITDNPDIFSSFDDTNLAIKELTEYIQFGLERGLGGAIEHSKIAKRLGRLFNFANEMAEIEGPNGFMSQAGGYEYIKDTAEPTIFDFGKAMERSKTRKFPIMKIDTYKRKFSAQAMAGGVKLDTGFKSITDNGSKLRNQLAVNSTQNIDAAIAQQTAIDYLEEDSQGTFMQVYDAFMGDSKSFSRIREIANKNFNDINSNYNLVDQEVIALKNLEQRVADEVARRIQSGEKFDIGLEGEFKSLGDFVFNPQRIVMRDMPNATDEQIDAKNKALREARSNRIPYLFKTIDQITYDTDGEKKLLISPKLFLELFNYANETLNIKTDLNRFADNIKKRKDEITSKYKLREGQYS